MDASTHKEIRKLFDEYIEMYSSRNDLLTNKFSSDFSGFAGGGDVLVKDRKEWIAVTRHDFSQVKGQLHIDIKDIAIQSLAEDVAVVTSFFTIKLPIKDDYFSRETVRLVLIFHKPEGQWIIAHSSISVPYGLVGKGEIYPLKGLEERNKLLEQIISERTRDLEKANSALRDSELRYRRLFEAAKDGILILDAETGMIVDVNPYLLSMLGYSHEQFLGKKVWELGFLKDIIANEDNFLELQQKRYVRYEDMPLETIDGRRIDVEFVSNMYEVDHQHVIQCNIRDISERKQAEKEFKQSEEKLRAIFNTMSEGVALNEIIYDEKGEMIDYRILEVNDAFYKTADINPGQVVGSRATELYNMSPESIKAFWESHKNETAAEHKEMCSPRSKRTYSTWTSPFHNNRFVTSFADITEQKRAEETLRERDAMLRAMFEASRDAIGVSKKGRHIYVNPSYLKLFGLENVESIVGTSIVDSIAPGDRNRITRNIELRAARESIPTFYEARGVKRDGTEFDIEISVSTYELNGELYSLGVIRDVTARKQAEEALSMNRERYRMLFEHAPIGIILADREGQILEVNPIALQVLGSPSFEATKEINIITFPPLVKSGISAALQSCVDSAKSSYGQYTYVTKWGKTIQTRLRYVPILDAINQTGMVNILIEDVTEQKKEEAKVAQLAAIVESSDEVIISTTLDGIITSWNGGAERIYGYNQSEIVGEPISILFPPDHANEMAKVLGTILAGKRLTRFETVRQGKSGQLIDMSLTVSPIKDTEGNISGVSTIGSDITEHKRAEKALRESEERFHRLFDVSPDAFLVFDPFSDANDWPIVDCNESACKMNGYTREELIGKSIYLLDPIQETPEGRAAYLNAVRQGEILHFESTHRHRDGHVFPIEVSNSIMTFQGRELVLGIDRDITERKRSEAALRESEQRFHRLFSGSPDALMLLDPSYDPNNWLVVDCNERACEMNGYTREELVGKSIAFLHAPDAEAEDCAAYLERIRHEGVLHFETSHQHRDGHVFPIETSTSMITFEGHELILGVDHDITEKRRVEKALRETQLRYRAAVEQSNDGIGIADLEGRYIMVNHALCKMTGYTEEEMLGMRVSDLVPKTTTLKLFKQILNNEDLNYRETELLRKDGTTFVAHITGSAIEVGNTRYMQGIVRDVTDRKRAEQQISDALEYIRTIFDASPIGIITFKESGEVLSANNAATTILGGTIDQLLEQNFRTVKSMERSGLQAAAISALSSCREADVEVHHVSTFGKDLWLSAHFIPFSHQAQIQLLLLLSDITERKQVEEALRHAQKLESIGTLAGGIAHDFNNLLNAMLGQSTLAMGKLASGSPARYHLEKSIQAADRAADLTRQLLAYSGRGKFVTETIDLNRIVEENAQLLKVSVPKTVHVISDLDSSNPRIHGDGGQIQQVIMNLIINASEAMGSNPGRITVRTDHMELRENDTSYSRYTNDPLPAGKYALLRVEDSGGGMSSETLGRIFDPFFSTKFTGRGLGLAAVLGIIRGHKGGVRIESEVGKGTTFEIIFPLLDDVATPEKQEMKEGVLLNGAGKKVLVIDDEESVVELLTDVFTDAKFTVLQTMNPIEGIELYRKHQQDISIVILDYSMPDMDGKAAFEELAKINRDVKVLLCSGYTEEEMQSGFGEIRPAGFIKKPYRPSTLLARVAKIISE